MSAGKFHPASVRESTDLEYGYVSTDIVRQLGTPSKSPPAAVRARGTFSADPLRMYCGGYIFSDPFFLPQQPAGERVLPHEHVTLNSVRHVDRTTELKTPSTGMRAQVQQIGCCCYHASVHGE